MSAQHIIMVVPLLAAPTPVRHPNQSQRRTWRQLSGGRGLGTPAGTITITDGANGNITIAPNGSGEVDVTAQLDVTHASAAQLRLSKDGSDYYEFKAVGGSGHDQ